MAGRRSGRSRFPSARRCWSTSRRSRPPSTKGGWLELEDVGFQILRASDGPEAAPVVISPIIPALGSELAGADYNWMDTSRQRRGVVYYYLEDIDTSGKITRHGPVEVELRHTVGTPPGHSRRGGS